MSKLSLTIKIKLLPDEEQSKIMLESMERYSSACNEVSKNAFEYKSFNRVQLHRELYKTIRSDYNLKSQQTCSVFRTVSAKYQALKSTHQELVQIDFSKPQCDLVWNKDYSLSKDTFQISTNKGRIKVPFVMKTKEEYFSSHDYRFGTAKLFYKKEKFYLLIPVTFEAPDFDPSKCVQIVGIDRGINFVVTSYDSKGKTTFIKGRHIKHKRNHYKQLRKHLQSKKTPSSRRRLKAIGKRENRWMNDVNHCISKALVKNNPQNTLFVLEDLTNIKENLKKVKKEDRYAHMSWSYYDLEQKLMYKAKKNQSFVIKVDPRYTSQKCPKCSEIEKSNRDKKKHIFKCKQCGYTSNDDRIGAMNIFSLGVEYMNGLHGSNAPVYGVQSITPNVTTPFRG